MLLLAALTLFSTDPSSACPGVTTLEVEACLTKELGREEDQLARYYEAALKRVGRENEPDMVKELAESERQWLAYRHAECSAVFDSWSPGTVRGSMQIECEIDLTRARTLAIWKNWLTYADRTPPILPRPHAEAVAKH